MQESIVQHLVCPEDKGPLTLKVDTREGSEILEGSLTSAAGKRYPILRGVPRFVDHSLLGGEQKETVDAFSFKWSRIPKYAFETKTKANREKWYFERFGFPKGDADLRAFLGGAKFALEAGTGTGVDTDLLARNFDGFLFGIDISTAIDEAYQRFRGNARVALVQADIGRLPFRAGFFDVVSCDQVLHHTPDPPGNFQKLASLLSPAGRMLLYVYKVKGALREFADDHLRSLMIDAPVEEAVEFSARMARLGKALSDLKVTVELPDNIPELGISKGKYDVQRLIYDHIVKCFWNDDYDAETNAMINFDWYRPRHAFRYTEEQVRGWAAQAKLPVQRVDVSPSGISVVMKK
ncbi:MAG: methyltransferase domain-containing protein [Myxococcota bacterium]